MGASPVFTWAAITRFLVVSRSLPSENGAFPEAVDNNLSGDESTMIHAVRLISTDERSCDSALAKQLTSECKLERATPVRSGNWCFYTE